MQPKESGSFIYEPGPLAVGWRGVNDAPFIDGPDPNEGMLFLGGARVDLRQGTVTGHMFGALTLCSGDHLYAGPYDGWAMYLDGACAVRWRAKKLREASAQGLVFEDGCEVKFGLHAVEMPKPLGTGLVRLECAISPVSPTRARRRATQRPDARLSADGKVITLQRVVGKWPPPPPPRLERTQWGRSYSY